MSREVGPCQFILDPIFRETEGVGPGTAMVKFERPMAVSYGLSIATIAISL